MRSSAIQSILAFLIFSLLSACSGKLTGSVFLDVDGDTERDDSEPYLGNLAFTVTKDGTDYAEGTTDSDGDFSVSIKGGGEYCVEVSQVDLIEESVTLVSSLTLPKILDLEGTSSIPVLQQVSSETDCDNNTDDDGDGDTDCDDTDCSSNSACSGTESDCDDDADNDSDGDTDCDDTDCSSNSACDTSSDTESDEVRESGRSCKDSASASVKLTVPVGKDYTVDDLQAEDPVQATVGETVEVRIVFPESCTFNLYTLPDGVEPVSDTVLFSNYETARRRINLVETISEDSDNVTTTESTSFAEDDLSTYEFSLVIDSDFLNSDTIEIAPTMDCPDGSTITLKTFTIEVDTDEAFSVTNLKASGDVESGDTIVIETTVTNNTPIAYAADTITLVLTVSSTVSDVTFDSDDDCTPSANQTTCHFALTASSDSTSTDEQTYSTSIELPTLSDTSDPVEISLTATLTIESGGATLEETDTYERTIPTPP